jgi:hypothetical protein
VRSRAACLRLETVRRRVRSDERDAQVRREDGARVRPGLDVVRLQKRCGRLEVRGRDPSSRMRLRTLAERRGRPGLARLREEYSAADRDSGEKRDEGDAPQGHGVCIDGGADSLKNDKRR